MKEMLDFKLNGLIFLIILKALISKNTGFQV